jgi:hypothetical protein
MRTNKMFYRLARSNSVAERARGGESERRNAIIYKVSSWESTPLASSF